MARAILSALLGDLRGKIGNMVFDNYKGVHIVRSMPTVTTNPQSAHQTDLRTAMAVFVQAWRGLTLQQKQLWIQVGCEFIRGLESDAKLNTGGLITVPRGPFSGYNAFIACNMNRYTSGYSLITDVLETAPLAQEKPAPLKSFSAVVGGRTITASWTYITPGPLDERLEIWIKSVPAGIHGQLIYTEARNADGSKDITQARKTSGILVDLPNGVYQLQAMIVNKYGLTTAPSELVFVQIGAEDMFTYLAVREKIINLMALAAGVPDTDLDLSLFIPAGAHTAILEARLYVATTNPGGTAGLHLYKSAAQGDAIHLQCQMDDYTMHNDNGHCPIDTARHIRYLVDFSSLSGNVDVEVWLLGYIS